MNNRKMCLSYLRGAKTRLDSARNALNSQDFAYVVRQSQECVELCLKGALRLAGIEPPKWHDVSFILKKEHGRFPSWFSEGMERLLFISKRLGRERGPSMYGDEEAGLTPEELYSYYEAETSLKEAEFVYETCQRLAQQFEERVET